MAFFDELGKKITNATQGAGESAKNFANVAKLNSMVREEEKQIESLYCQLGKLYYENNSIQPDDPYADLVAAIIASKDTLESYNEQIKEIKGVTNCPNCGAEVSYSSMFCNSCGSKIPAKTHYAPANSVQCPVCGNFVAEGYKFCTSCGNVMGEAAPAPAAPIAPAPVQSAGFEPANKLCPVCGKELKADAVFCTGCGSKVG